MGDADGSELAGARGRRWSPVKLLRSIDEAAAFVEDVGFALLFPADRPNHTTTTTLPSATASPPPPTARRLDQRVHHPQIA